MTQEIRTFLDIQNAVISRANFNGADTTVRNQVKQAINIKYQSISTKKAYSWSGVTTVFPLSKYYNTGTVTISQDSDTLTGASTVWSETNHLFWKVKLGSDGYPYKIIAINDVAQTAILDVPYTGSSLSAADYYFYRDDYGLFPDLYEIRKLIIPGLVSQWQPTQCSPTVMDDLRTRSPFRTGSPRKYTINGNAHYRGKTWASFNINQDFWEDALSIEPRNRALLVWPGVLTNSKIAQIRYTIMPQPMNNDTDEPKMPYGQREVLVWGALLDSFTKNRNIQIKNEWEKEFLIAENKLSSSIETVSDELLLVVDSRGYRRLPSRVDMDEGLYNIE